MKVLLIVLTFATGVYAQELMNLDDAKRAVEQFYENGTYDSLLYSTVKDAKEKIDSIELNDKSAVIFDVDDTVLSGYEYSKALGFGFTFPTWAKHLNKAEQKAVPHMLEFYNYLKANNIRIVFLTGRDNVFYESTKRNLEKRGFTGYDTLICRNNSEKELPASVYKETKRKELAEKGYSIIACVGDQESDLKGSFTGMKIKIPNYLYKIH